MSAIYVPLPAPGYELCQPLPPTTFEDIHLLANGFERAKSWQPLEFRIVRDDEGRELIGSDAPWLASDALVFRKKSIDSIGEMLKSSGELLEINCENERLYIYNVTIICDALDEGASSLTRFKNGRVMMIKNYVFREKDIPEFDVFKISSLRVSPNFLSQRFVDAWTGSNLKGLEFRRVWSPVGE